MNCTNLLKDPAKKLYKILSTETTRMIDLGSDITQEKVKELKRMIDLQLRSKDVYGQIRSVLSDFLNQNQDIIDVNSEESVLQSMRERGILEQVINTLNGQGNRASIKDDVASSLLLKNNKQLLKNKRLLHLKILGGKAFLEFPDEQVSQLPICESSH